MRERESETEHSNERVRQNIRTWERDGTSERECKRWHMREWRERESKGTCERERKRARAIDCKRERERERAWQKVSERYRVRQSKRGREQKWEQESTREIRENRAADNRPVLFRLMGVLRQDVKMGLSQKKRCDRSSNRLLSSLQLFGCGESLELWSCFRAVWQLKLDLPDVLHGEILLGVSLPWDGPGRHEDNVVLDKRCRICDGTEMKMGSVGWEVNGSGVLGDPLLVVKYSHLSSP